MSNEFPISKDFAGFPDESFIQQLANRLFAAAFAHKSPGYDREVVVYEATVTPLLYRPQIGHTWRKFAPRSQVVDVVGTHISIMHAPYVQAWADDLRFGFSFLSTII